MVCRVLSTVLKLKQVKINSQNQGQ
uniref:Uncharacterized protein n=1 Tax=Anguilla anguilla TaxID=7936 RepID=A0A0E9R0E5_ANGAN